ncbi:MAG: FecCD family ABC transporter permease [Acidimicrobiia bacterium]
MSQRSSVLPSDTIVVSRRTGRRSVKFQRRAALVTLGLLGLTISCGAIALITGGYPIPLTDAIGALLGDRDGLADSIVVNWRLPRVLATLLFGAALGASGALFQSLAANPLASPDVVGFDSGAMTGALVVLLVLRAGPGSVAAGALIGGIATAIAVYVLAYRRGVQGFRLILVGIAVSAMLAAVNQYLLVKALRSGEIVSLQQVRYWAVGTLNGITWGNLRAAGLLLAVLLPAALVVSRPLRWIEMGDDAATALGIRLNPTRVAIVLVGVGLTATVTSVCGPIGFVALAAPQLGRRLTRSAGVAVPAAMAMGAGLLGVSDLMAQRLFWVELPVGAITVAVGGVYFVWLLFQETRR